MNLTTSWTDHFIAIGNSGEAIKNMAFFSTAMKPDQTTKSEKINDLVKEDGTVTLVIGKAGQIKFFTASKNLGEQDLAQP
jgi:hypothetical protein